MTIAEFDNFETEKKKELLKQCCNSAAWVNKMLTAFPVEDLVDLMEDAEEKWYWPLSPLTAAEKPDGN